MPEQEPVQQPAPQETPQEDPQRKAVEESRLAAEALRAYGEERPEESRKPLGEDYEKFRREYRETRERANKIKELIKLSPSEIASASEEQRREKGLPLAGGELKDDVLRKLAKQVEEAGIRPSRIEALREQYLSLLKEEEGSREEPQSTKEETAPSPEASSSEGGGPEPRAVKEGAEKEGAETERTPEGERTPEDFERRYGTDKPEKELEEAQDRHEKILKFAESLIRNGEEVRKDLKITPSEVETFLAPILASVFEEYAQGKYHALKREVEHKVNTDTGALYKAFDASMLRRFRDKELTDELVARIEEQTGIGAGFETFYKKIQKGGKLRAEDVKVIISGLLGEKIAGREQRVLRHITETLRRQKEFKKEWGEAKKNYEALTLEAALMKGRAPSAEIDEVLNNARRAQRVMNDIGDRLPAQITSQPRSKFKTFLRAQLLRLKR